MEAMKTNLSLPFNSYDFFGYILPGTLFSSGLIYIFKDCSFFQNVTNDFKGLNTFLYIIIAFIAIAVLYFMGQIIGCIAHLIYDRMIVRNIIGYPLQYILDLKPRPDDSVRITYLFLSVWILVLILVPSLYELLCKWIEQKYSWIVIVIISASFGILFIVAFVLRLSLVYSQMNRMDNREHIVKKAEDSSIEKDPIMKKICAKGARILWCIFFPIRKLTSTDTKVDPQIRNLFIKKLKNKTGIDLRSVKQYNSDAYWIAYISLFESVPQHDAKIGNWLNLYGCLRNYSCSFLILSGLVAIKQWKVMWNNQESLPDTFVLAIFISLTFILFIRYWIVYFSYYTKYIIRAFALCKEPSKKQPMKS